MKTIKGLLYMLAIAAFGFAAGCSDDDVDGPSGILGDGVYFATNTPTEYLLSTGQTSVTVPVCRSKSEGQLSVLVLPDMDPSYENIFTVSEALFADGQTTAECVISFAFSNIEAGKTYSIPLILGADDHLTDYGNKNITVNLLYDPWTLLGKATWRDDILGSTFDLDCGFPETQVNVYESDITPGMYRLENVYSPSFVASIVGASPDEVSGNCAEAYIIINATNPDKVWIEMSEIGLILNSEYGWMSIGSDCEENGVQDAYNLYGKLKDNVISFPDKQAIVLLLPDYEGGRLLSVNQDGMTRIVLPGGQALEPAVEVEFSGILTNADGDASAIFNTTKNADASKVLYAVAEGDLTGADQAEALAAFVAGIKDGSVASETITADGEVSYKLSTPGDYTAVFIPVAEAAQPVYGPAATVYFDYTSGGTAPSEFAATFSFEEVDETMATVIVKPNADNLTYLWLQMETEAYNQAIAEYNSIDVYMEGYFAYLVKMYADNGIDVTVANLVAELISKGESTEKLSGLTPDTEYTVFAYCIDKTTGKARSGVSTGTFRTLTLPELDADYQSWLGTWEVTTSGLETAATISTFEVTFALEKSNTSFTMTGWGNHSASGIPLRVFYMATDTGSIIGIPEQKTGEQANTPKGIADIYFFARIFHENRYLAYGGGTIALMGYLTGADSGELIGYEIQDEDGNTYTTTGADYFALAGDALYSFANISLAPYSLKKVQPEATSAVRSNIFDAVPASFKARAERSSKIVRMNIFKTYNCVERL